MALDSFRRSAQRFPDHVAVTDRNRSLSYADLDARSEAVASRLQMRGFPARTVVGTYMDACTDYVVTVLGILKAGMVFLPLDTKFPAARLRAILAKTRARAIIGAPEALADLTGKLDPADQHPDLIELDGSAPSTAPMAEPANAPTLPDHIVDCASSTGSDPSDACYVVTTSGTTGEPKAILGSGAGLSHFVTWEADELSLDDRCRVSLLSPVTFDVSLRDIFVPLAVGGSIRIPDRETVTRPTSLLRWLREHEITVAHVVPTVFRGLTRVVASEPRSDGSAALPDLAWMLLAGEPLYGKDVAAWRTVAGTGTRLVNVYGPSETTLAKFFYPIPDEPPASGEMIPVGRPLPDTEARLMRDGRACRPEEPGEVFIRTAFPSLGYLGDEELSRVRFTETEALDPSNTVPSLTYRTGDLGTVAPDGTLRLLGRLDGQVKLFGKRIELAEIELRMREHPEVRDAAAAVREDASGTPKLVGYVVPDGERTPSVEGLRAFVAETLPDYMVPHVFRTLERLPLTHSLKLDRNALPAPSQARPELETPYVVPRTPGERRLAGIWADVLGLERVGIQDGFFDLGGTSISIVQLAERIEAEMGVHVPVTTIFGSPTVASLAGQLDGSGSNADTATEIQERAKRRRAAISTRRR